MLSILSCVCWQSVYLLWRNVYTISYWIIAVAFFLVFLSLPLPLIVYSEHCNQWDPFKYKSDLVTPPNSLVASHLRGKALVLTIAYNSHTSYLSNFTSHCYSLHSLYSSHRGLLTVSTLWQALSWFKFFVISVPFARVFMHLFSIPSALPRPLPPSLFIKIPTSQWDSLNHPNYNCPSHPHFLYHHFIYNMFYCLSSCN